MENIPQAVRAQIAIARDDYRACFGRDPAGIWLPECAYVAGIDQVLQEANLRWFILDAHGLMYGQPRPRRAIYAPCFTPAGPAAFARDRESSRQVWSAQHGYPGDPAYRDFYRDIGFELTFPDLELTPRIGPSARRGNSPASSTTASPDAAERKKTSTTVRGQWRPSTRTRVTSWTNAAGRSRVSATCSTWTPSWSRRSTRSYSATGGSRGRSFWRCSSARPCTTRRTFELTTPGRYLDTHPRQQMVAPSASSWGQNGYWEVWLHASNAWIYPHLQTAARRMVEAARAEVKGVGFLDRAARAGRVPDADETLRDRLLRQMARELLLAQSSDWAFLMKTGTATHYAAKRTRDHVLRFTRLYEQWKQRRRWTWISSPTASGATRFFPSLDWKYYV